MSRLTMAPRSAGVTRNRMARFASLHAEQMAERAAEREERLLDEERAALRVATQSTCQKDRSAVQALAEHYRVDDSAIYNMADGRVKRNPLREFCEFVDVCVAAKGADNPAALEPVRLLRRRYLDQESGEASFAGVLGTSGAAMKEVGEAIALAVAAAQDGIDAAEAAQLDAEIDQAVAALHALRREIRSAAAGGAR